MQPPNLNRLSDNSGRSIRDPPRHKTCILYNFWVKQAKLSFQLCKNKKHDLVSSIMSVYDNSNCTLQPIFILICKVVFLIVKLISHINIFMYYWSVFNCAPGLLLAIYYENANKIHNHVTIKNSVAIRSPSVDQLLVLNKLTWSTNLLEKQTYPLEKQTCLC